MVSQRTGDSALPTTQMDSLVVISDSSSGEVVPPTATDRSRLRFRTCGAGSAKHDMQQHTGNSYRSLSDPEAGKYSCNAC